MSMVFCRGCGKEIHETAPTCPHCGAPQVSSARPIQPSVPVQAHTPQAVSAAWAMKFALIDKAGGPKLPAFKTLPFGEQIKVVFNIWAFLAGPIYYLFKGMWKKALTLMALAFVTILVVDYLFSGTKLADLITGLTTATIFGTRATIDFYKKVVRGENGWW